MMSRRTRLLESILAKLTGGCNGAAYTKTCKPDDTVFLNEGGAHIAAYLT